MFSPYNIKFKLLSLLLINLCCSQEFKGFDDTILYKINWPGKDVADRLVKEQEENILNVKTAIGESYQCVLPKQDEVNKESEPSYNGPSPLELLSPLFSKQACSYRVDTYWIYEICHGRHVRQYHNEREGKSQKEQEYFLGKWKIFDGLKLEEELKRLINLNYPGPTNTRKVDGVNLPYFEMIMSGGTVCDLSGRPRQTNVLYVCYPPSSHNIFSVKETSTCQYEVIVLTSYLCSHPWYKPPNSDELSIDCLSVEDSPRKPHNLKVLQSDTSKLKKHIKMLTDPLNKKEMYKLSFSIDKNGETKIQVQIQPTTETESNSPLMIHSKTPNNEIEEYINGNICLYGGSGWWKYEICYNKYIQQVHKEKGKPDEVVVLGVFDLQEHIKWLSQNEEKKPKSNAHSMRQVVSHFYSSGSICQKTGEKRETEVRYKCIKGRYNEHSFGLNLLEPKTCKYVLTIESSSLCEIINGPMDEYGIFNLKSRLNRNEKIRIISEKEEEDKLKQHIEEHVLRKETFPSVEQETEESDEKKKIGKIEL